MYDSLEEYTPRQIKNEVMNMVKTKFKHVGQCNFMEILNEKNKKTLSDYYELCKTSNLH